MIVLDTNVVPELMRARPSPAVVGWLRDQRAADLYTTAVTVAEIRYGIERLPDGRRKDRLGSTADDVFAAFPEQILSFDAVAAVEYARVVARRERAGAPIDGFDAQIAAVCRVHAASLATRNLQDFKGTGIDVVDPWQEHVDS